ncbi:hypothetical protein TWF730_007074 [Orbilia blumenaviensis]|uniref:3CxxC-type domain-containing protein n=1 Tax=Orbilia blumenaviensis TaxID=1796055 RepID=A0AAV9VIP8_9PEZI
MSKNKNFRKQLAKMERSVLNALKMENYTRAQRRLINDERVRRKQEDTANTIDVAAVAENLNPILHQITVASSSTNSGQQQQSGDAGSDPRRSRRTGQSNGSGGSSHASGATTIDLGTRLLFPGYHESVSEQVEGVSFSDNIGELTLTYGTNLVGSFRCPQCHKVWTTGIIWTRIKGKILDHGQLEYCAVVFKQSCKKCEKLGIMKLEEDVYVERVARRLKIWKGEPVPPIEPHVKGTPPHEIELCEGCNAGECKRGRGSSNR